MKGRILKIVCVLVLGIMLSSVMSVVSMDTTKANQATPDPEPLGGNPDFTVSTLSMVEFEKQINGDYAVTVEVGIENIGDPIDCDVNTEVAFDFATEPLTILFHCEGNTIIDSPVTFDLLWPKSISGSHTLSAVVDAWEVIDELDEDNNEMSITVNALSRSVQFNNFLQNFLNRIFSRSIFYNLILEILNR